jgi:hypothetical protein
MKIMNLTNSGYEENTNCWLDMVSKPTNIHECIKVIYNHSMPPTCYGQSCGHPKGEELQRIDISRYYEGLRTKVQMQNSEF